MVLWSITRPSAIRCISLAKKNRRVAATPTAGVRFSFSAWPMYRWQLAKHRLSVEEMIKDVKKGIYIIGDGSFSIDQQRYNFQFGGQLFYEIKDGKIAGMLKDVAYQSNTQEFWNSCAQVCDERDYRLGGSFFDGKGQPSQSSAVSHGSSTTRFNGVNVINTARKI